VLGGCVGFFFFLEITLLIASELGLHLVADLPGLDRTQGSFLAVVIRWEATKSLAHLFRILMLRHPMLVC